MLLLIRALQRGDVLSPVLMGICFAIYMLYTFRAYMVALQMAPLVLLALVSRATTVPRVLKTLAISIAAFAAFYLLLYATTGFNIISCFRRASELHLLRSGSGFDTLGRYLLRSFGGILAYLASIGFPIAVLAYTALRRQPDVERTVTNNGRTAGYIRAFVWATAICIILVGFSGMVFLETERIWLLFSPLLAVCAAYELHRRSLREGRLAILGVILLSLVFTLAYALPFEHRMGPRFGAAGSTEPSDRPAP